MTITHHPAEETLAAYGGGHLDDGRRLVVGAHIGLCGHCQRWQSQLERVGGVLLNESGPAPMRPDALAAALARLDQGQPAETVSSPPDILKAYAAGPWSWIGRGIHHRALSTPGTNGARVFLLKVGPGIQLPEHTHTGTELTLVLSGAFSHAGGRFGPGDIEAHHHGATFDLRQSQRRTRILRTRRNAVRGTR